MFMNISDGYVLYSPQQLGHRPFWHLYYYYYFCFINAFTLNLVQINTHQDMKVPK